MLQRGLDYAAATIIVCAVCAALLVLAAEILSFSSPVADTAATLGAAVLLKSLRRRIRAVAKHRFGQKTRIASGGRPTEISAGVLRRERPPSRVPAGVTATWLLPRPAIAPGQDVRGVA
jgi:hypothetical protein